METANSITEIRKLLKTFENKCVHLSNCKTLLCVITKEGFKYKHGTKSYEQWYLYFCINKKIRKNEELKNLSSFEKELMEILRKLENFVKEKDFKNTYIF